ncbi:MAG: ChbG/HpnK family deacetylase [Phycisphaerales bacterium]|nr:ChbG/HpnK family deacetylase [Phycisphaerales bacterium]
MSTVLVNADDFGLHADIDRGILQCIDAGVVQSISFSPQGVSLDWTLLAQLARRGVKVGLHLTLVGEPWGTDGRVFTKWPQLVRWVTLGGSNARRALDAEADWQMRQCLEHNIHLDHIDSHQHVHVFPAIWSTARRLQRQHAIARIRTPFCPGLKLIKKNIPGLALQTLARWRAAGVDQPLPCLGLSWAGHNDIDILTRELTSLDTASPLKPAKPSTSPIVELVMHPGVNTPALEARYDDWHFDWTGERDALLDPRLRVALKSAGLSLFRPDLNLAA